MAARNGKAEWIRVSKDTPCAVCAKPDYCSRTADGLVVHCMRVEGKKPAKSGGWIHRLDEPLPAIELRAKEERKRPDIDWSETARKMAANKHAAAAREETARQLGVSIDALEQLQVGHGRDREAFTSWPERDPGGKVLGINRRYADGRKKAMRWSQHGLYYTRNWWIYPGPVFCPEGGSDTAALVTMGLPAVGRPSNVAGAEMLARMLRGMKWIIVLGERDNKPGECGPECFGCMKCWPGLAGAVRTAEIVAERVRGKVQAALPRDAKDVRDWLVKHKRQDGMTLGEQFSYELEIVWCSVR